MIADEVTEDYTPTTEEMREYFAMGPYQPWAKAPMSDDARAAMFDRWLAQHDEQVKYAAQAQREQSAGYEVVTDAEGDRIIRAKPSQLFDLTAARVEAAAHVISTRTEEPVWSAIVIARAALTAALDTMKEGDR